MEDRTEVVRQRTAQTGHIPYMAGLFLFVLIFDLVTKHLVQNRFELGESVPWLGDTVRLTYILNAGGAFGISIGSNMVYLVVSLVVIVAVIYLVWSKIGSNKLIDFSLVAVIGGAVGNLVDRFRFGAVVDFLDVDIPNLDFIGIQMHRWPVFNVADAAVTIGMILIIFALLFTKPEDQAQERSISEETV